MKKTNKKFEIKELLKSFAIFAIVVSIVLFVTSPAFATSLSETVTEVVKPGGTSDTVLPGYDTTGHAEASYEEGASGITSAILFVVDLFKYLLQGVAILVIIASGIRLVTAGKKVDEVATQQKDNIKYALVGLIIVILADTMIKQVFFGEQGEVYRSEADVQMAAERGTAEIRGLYSMLSAFAASIAVLFIIIAGVRMVISGGQEEVITKQKKQLMYAALGLVLIGISELVVKDIVFPEYGEALPDVERAKQLIVNLTNFISSFVATVSIAMLMYGGYLYVTAVGKEENIGKAKKVFFGAIIGLVIAMAAFAIVNTFIRFEAPTDVDITGTEGLPGISETATP